MGKTFIKLLVFTAIAVAAFFLLRHHVLWLDSFEGTIQERIEDQVPTVTKDVGQEISYYYFRIQTDEGRDLVVPVKQLLYFRARPGMRVTKSSFSSSVSLLE